MRSVRRVLVVQPYGIGDLLFVTPVLRALRLHPTVEKVDMLLGSRTDSVIRHNPHVDETFVIDKDVFHARKPSSNLRELWQLGLKLRKQHYDLLLDYSLRGEYAFFSQFFLGIPRRAGFAYKDRGFFHNLRVPLRGGYQGRHVVEYFCDLAENAGIPVEDRSLEFYLGPKDRMAAREVLHKKAAKNYQNYLIVSPGGGESWGRDAYLKRWPVSFFAALSKRLAGDLDMDGVVIVGSSGEKELGESFVREWNQRVPVINLMGEMSLGHTAAMIGQAAIFIGNDGGLVHVAHALRTPLLAFYGPVDHRVYGPYPESSDAIAVYQEKLDCRPCYRNFRYRSDCPKCECLQGLLPEAVYGMPQTRKFVQKLQTVLPVERKSF